MIKSESKIIGGYEYKVTQLPAMLGLFMSKRLIVLLGPIVGELLASTDNGKKSFDSLDVGKVANTLATALKELSDDDLQDIINKLFYNTTVKIGMQESLLMPQFNELMADRFLDIFTLLAFAIQVNFGNFTSALLQSKGVVAGNQPVSIPVDLAKRKS